MESIRGTVGPTISAGRAPAADDEIALGARTLDQLGAEIGGQVEVVTPEDERHTLTVVGRAVFAGLGTYSGADNTELGTGALVSRDALEELGPDFEKEFIVVDLRPGVSGGAELLGEHRDLVDEGTFMMATDPLRPADIVHLEKVRAAPILLSALLGVFALATLTHALVTSVRHRRRDLAVLRALGFARRQVAATVAWQATTVAVIALAIGLPLGVAAGRWLWSLVAEGLATPAAPVTPALAVLGLTAGDPGGRQRRRPGPRLAGWKVPHRSRAEGRVMASLRYRLRAEARNRWRAWLGLALLVGLAAGAVISLAAGARRTGDAYQRLAEAEQPPHAFIPDQGWSVLPTAARLPPKGGRAPEVVETSRVSGVADESGVTQDGVKMGEPDYVNSFIPLDSAAVDALARQKLIEGRHPDPTAAEEVVVNFTVADRYGLDVGEWFELDVIAGSVYDARFEGRHGPPDPTRRIRFDVVGIVAAANEFPPRSFGDGAGTVIHSREFATAHADRLPSREALFVRLGARADLPDFVASVEALADGSDFRLIGASYVTAARCHQRGDPPARRRALDADGVRRARRGVRHRPSGRPIHDHRDG